MHRFIARSRPRLLAAAFAAALGLCASPGTAQDLHLRPMHGGQPKTAEMRQADDAFIAGVLRQGLSRREGAQRVSETGWAAWHAGDNDTAMRRFNQAWLLDPGWPAAYHGMAIVWAQQDGPATEVEALFRLATSQDTPDARALVDHGQFLQQQRRHDEALVALHRALQVDPRARNARANIAFVHYRRHDFKAACEWALAARFHDDRLEPGFAEDMCQ